MLRDRRRKLVALGTFVVVYGALNAAPEGLGRALSEAACAAANAVVGAQAPRRELQLWFVPASPRIQPTRPGASLAWTTILFAQRSSTGAGTAVAIDLRKTLWVPLAVFVALTLASAVWFGMLSLPVLMIGVVVAPIPTAYAAVMHVVGTLYEQYVVELGGVAQATARFTHAVLDPPAMAYAIPLLVWAALTLPRAHGH